MKKNDFFNVIVILFLTLLITGCSPSLSLIVNNDESVRISASNRCTDELNTLLSSYIDTDDNSQIADSASMKAQLEDADFKNVSVSLNKIADININATASNISQLDNLVSNVFKAEKDSNKNKIIVTINPSIILENKEFMEDAAEIFELLMAPIYTGEELTEKEYLEILASFYGQKAVNEFEKSVFKINVTVPKSISSVEKKSAIGTINSKENCATITIPVYKLLCNMNNNVFIIQY